MFVSGGSTVLSSSKNISPLDRRRPEAWASIAPQRQNGLFIVAPQSAERQDTRLGMTPFNRAQVLRL
jgi:hypothetical protein